MAITLNTIYCQLLLYLMYLITIACNAVSQLINQGIIKVWKRYDKSAVVGMVNVYLTQNQLTEQPAAIEQDVSQILRGLGIVGLGGEIKHPLPSNILDLIKWMLVYVDVSALSEKALDEMLARLRIFLAQRHITRGNDGGTVWSPPSHVAYCNWCVVKSRVNESTSWAGALHDSCRRGTEKYWPLSVFPSTSMSR